MYICLFPFSFYSFWFFMISGVRARQACWIMIGREVFSREMKQSLGLHVKVRYLREDDRKKKKKSRMK